MSKYHLISIMADVSPTPTTTQESWQAEVVVREGAHEKDSVFNAEVKIVGRSFKTMEEAMTCSSQIAEVLNKAMLGYAEGWLKKYEDA